MSATRLLDEPEDLSAENEMLLDQFVVFMDRLAEKDATIAQLRTDLARSVAREKELIRGASRLYRFARGETAELRLGAQGRRR